jgi:hypothetical protein
MVVWLPRPRGGPPTARRHGVAGGADRLSTRHGAGVNHLPFLGQCR